MIGSNSATTKCRSPPKMTSELDKPEIMASVTFQCMLHNKFNNLGRNVLFESKSRRTNHIFSTNLKCRSRIVLHHICNFCHPRTSAGAPIRARGEEYFLTRIAKPPTETNCISRELFTVVGGIHSILCHPDNPVDCLRTTLHFRLTTWTYLCCRSVSFDCGG